MQQRKLWLATGPLAFGSDALAKCCPPYLLRLRRFDIRQLLNCVPPPVSVKKHGDQATLTIARYYMEKGYPLYVLANALKEQFHISLSTEQAMENANAVTFPNKNPGIQTRPLTVPFALKPDGQPRDVIKLLQDIRDAINARSPFAYRLDRQGNSFALVSTRAKNKQGAIIAITPLLDRCITLPPISAPASQVANEMTKALSAQVGYPVFCCGGPGVAGIPWGSETIAFSATDEPARNVLRRLLKAVFPSVNKPETSMDANWNMACEVGFGCVINTK